MGISALFPLDQGEHSPCSKKWQAGICPHGSAVTPWGHQAEVRSDATSEFTSGYQRQKQHLSLMESLDQSFPHAILLRQPYRGQLSCHSVVTEEQKNLGLGHNQWCGRCLSLRAVTLEGTRESNPIYLVSEGLRLPEGEVSVFG